MSDYPEISIGSLCDESLAEIQTGPFGSQLHAHEYVENGIPVVPTEAIIGRRIDHDVLPQITKNKAASLARHRLEVGDILFARRGVQATGRSAIVREAERGFICGTGAIRLRLRQPYKVFLPEYLSLILSAPRSVEWIRFHAIGATMPNLNEGIIRGFSAVAPPIPVQKDICELLGALDDKIDLNRRMIETLEAMARAIFKDWFVDFGPTRAKQEGRDPYLAPDIWSLFPDRLDEEGKPEGWEQRPFGSLLKDSIGGDWGTETASDISDVAVNIIRGTDLPEVAGGGTGKIPTRWTTGQRLASRELSDVDIVIEVSGGSPTQPTGRSILITNSILKRFSHPLVCASFCRRFRPLAPEIGFLLARHLSYLYSTGGTWQYQNQSTGIANFQTTRFLEEEMVIWPCRALCNAFAGTIEPLVRAITRNESLSLAATRDLLLPKLMSGEIRVREAEKIAEAVA